MQQKLLHLWQDPICEKAAEAFCINKYHNLCLNSPGLQTSASLDTGFSFALGTECT